MVLNLTEDPAHIGKYMHNNIKTEWFVTVK